MQGQVESEDQMQLLMTQEARISKLEESVQELKLVNENLMRIISNMQPINQFPVNRTNWVKQSPKKWSLDENGETYVVKSSTTWQSRDDHAPHNLFTRTEGEIGRWATENGQQNNSYVTLKYPRKVKCNHMRIKNRANFINECPQKFEIRGSNQDLFEKDKYVVFKTIDKLKLAPNEVKEFFFENDDEYEYYSIFIYLNNGIAATALSELNFGYIYHF